MKIELKEITVRELTDGYENNAEAGVVDFGEKLDIRPPYQREFIYKDMNSTTKMQMLCKEDNRTKAGK